MAKRLAENSSVTVAVVEAGGFYEAENGNVSVVPAYDVTYNHNPGAPVPPVDWGFTTVPQAVCLHQLLDRRDPIFFMTDRVISAGLQWT